jgi:uncharacterized glyoxalase superfamily protein PhnB
MKLVQSRIVTEDVEGMAAFYARLVGASVTLNEYYVEVPAGAISIGFSKRRFTEYREREATPSRAPAASRSELILDFLAADVDAEFERVARLGVEWVMPPRTQPWGNRSMIFRDPEGNLVDIFSRDQLAGE